jgi:hypothetical protein
MIKSLQWQWTLVWPEYLCSGFRFSFVATQVLNQRKSWKKREIQPSDQCTGVENSMELWSKSSPKKMHLAPTKWAAWQCLELFTEPGKYGSWYSNDFFIERLQSNSIANCFRMEACLELILASQCKSLFSIAECRNTSGCWELFWWYDERCKFTQILFEWILGPWKLPL